MARRVHTTRRSVWHGASSPYHRSAWLYDRLLGRRMLPLFVRNFGELVRRYNAVFRSIADVGCGTGDFVRYLNRWGIPVIGVDRSSIMIALAQRRNQGRPGQFLVQDLRRLRLPRRVDLITCNFDVLNYLLTVSDLKQAFRSFHQNLGQGGHVIFDMIVDTGRPWRRPRRVLRIRTPGLRSVWTITRHPRHRLRRVVMQHQIAQGNGAYSVEREVHTQRAYPLAVVAQVLRRCGFVVKGMHHAYSLQPATASDPRVVFVAQKQRARARPR